MPEQPPATLPADFFDKQGGPPQTLPADFKFDEEPGIARRFYEKTPIAPIVNQMSANLPSPAEGGGAMATQLVKNAGSLIANMAKGQWNAMSADFKAASDSADKGDHLQAINHFLRAARRIYDPITTQAQDTVESLATDLTKGNLAGAAGTLSPALLGLAGEAVPAIARAAPEAGAIAKDAVVGGYKGGIALTPSVGGVRLPASAAGLVGGGVADIGAMYLGLPPEILPAIGFATPIVKGAVSNVRAGMAARAATEATEAAKASTSARVPVWQGPPAEAAAPSTPATFGDLMNPSQADLQAILDRNRSARIAPTPVAEVIPAPIIEQPTYTPPTPAGKPGVTQVPSAAVRPVEYGAGSGHFGEDLAPASSAPVPARAPVWQSTPTEAAAPAQAITFGDLMNPSQADLQAILDRNRAARNAATDARDPQGAPQVIARLKALGNEPQPAPAAPPATAPGTITIKQLASDPETFNRIARASMINDNLTAMASKLGYSAEDLQALKSQNPAAFDDLVSRISKTPLGTKNPTWWRDSAKPASPATRAVMDELPNSLKNNPKALAAAQALAEEMRKSQ